LLPQFIYYLLQFDKPYRKLKVDEMPAIETLEKLNYQELTKAYQVKH